MAAARKPVLLGLRDAAVRGRPTGPSAWTASKLGGVPDALPAVPAPRPVCERCGQPLALVVQVYCPLDGSPFHRLLHVFACPQPGCGSCGTRSWKVFRSQCLQTREKEAQDTQKQENGLTAKDWCEGADDWGSDSEEAPPPQLSLDSGNDSSSARDADWTVQLQDLRLQDSVPVAAPPVSSGGKMALSSVVPWFLPYYICVVDEDDYGDFGSLDHAHSLLREYQQREGMDMEQLLSQSFSSDGSEKYEKTIIKNGDKMFYKFMKRIAACQEQILRYSWNGEPLFLKCPPSDVTDLPGCSHCGGQRIFEFQLMPALVSMLRSADLGNISSQYCVDFRCTVLTSATVYFIPRPPANVQLPPITNLVPSPLGTTTLFSEPKDVFVEFGTILIYTCEKSCWPQNHQTPLEEFCIIQEDPDESLFK